MPETTTRNPSRVWPGLENAVRALLWDSVAEDHATPVRRWNPQEREANVPLVVANGLTRLVPVGMYNHAEGTLVAVHPRQVSRAALAGVKYSDFSAALLSMSMSELGPEHGILAWTDEEETTLAYAPLDAVYFAASYVLTTKK